MKKLIFLSVLLTALFVMSCEKEVIKPFVAFSGSFTNTPDPSAGFWEIAIPDGSTFMYPKKYVVDGTSALFGNVDEATSVLESSNIAFNLKYGGFSGDLKITLVDTDGDELVLKGEFLSFQDFSNNAYLHVDSGTGKWEKAEGWMNSAGQVNPDTGVNTLTGEGEITEPK